MTVTTYQGDCLELMGNISDHSVDMVLCDLPYGTTRNEWDVTIPMEQLWESYHRIVRGGGLSHCSVKHLSAMSWGHLI